MAPVSELGDLLRTLEPVRNPGVYVFVSMPAGATPDPAGVAASIREPDGWSVIMEQAAARAHGYTPVFECAWITLSVNSDLGAVGLTAAVATALADAGIPCNVVAGALHDHLFVPLPLAESALAVLRALQQAGAGARLR